MSIAELIIVSVAVVPTFGLAAWLWYAAMQVEDELQSL